MTRTKTTQEIQVESQVVTEELAHLAGEQAKLQNRLIALTLLEQVKQHGVARPYTTWFVAGK
jgi:hypothetical protein